MIGLWRANHLFLMKGFISSVTLLLLSLHEHVYSCKQAWNGGGTGSWYRVDTSCQYSVISTTLLHCLPSIIFPSNTTSTTDGFYVSLGIFNRINGVSADVGLTYDPQEKKWLSYANDDKGWKSGNISIDSLLNQCVNASLSIVHGFIRYTIRTVDGSTILGEDIYLPSQVDPSLNLTTNSSDMGFYRFDSIAQTKETLKSGSQMVHAQMMNWMIELSSQWIVSADPEYIASNVRGYAPGSCCTEQEINTITVHTQVKWNQSDISISYV